MTSAHFTSLGQYRDLEALNAYRQRVEEAKIQSGESMMAALALIGRDNSRTPMQWDASAHAGFMAADATGEPWIEVNPNHVEINAAAAVDDPDSVYAFYKRLIALRHDNPVVAAGDWRLVDEADEHVYAFTRTLDGVTLLVMVNVSGDCVRIPAESAALLSAAGADESHIVIATQGASQAAASLSKGELEPWAGIVIQL